MAYIADDKKQEIRDRVRLEDLARDYGVILQPASGDRLKGLCPFHSEKTPSFSVNAALQLFYCFGCQAKGDVFTFVQRVENVDFLEAMEMLARRAGVVLEPERGGRHPRGPRRSTLYDALALAEDFYHRVLLADPRAEPARRYLLGRGITRETWERFRLGYSVPEWDAFLRFATAKGLAQEVLEAAGLIRTRDSGRAGPGRGVYDYFRGRVMFPIGDGQKRTIGFGARCLGDEQPKYLNTASTPVFEKSQVLYGLPQARAAIEREKRLAIVEGYTDVIAAHQAGLEYFVASLGTAFTQENARRLRRLAPRVDLVFDGDFAGQNAAERSLALLVAEDLDVRIFTLSGGEDPFDALRSLGGEGFSARLEREAVGIFEFKWKRTVGSLAEDEQGAGARARAFEEVLDLLLRVPNVIARKLYVKEFAEKLGVSADDVEKRLKRKASNGRAASIVGAERGEVPNGTPAQTAASRAGHDNPSLEEVILETILAEPDRAAARWSQLPQFLFNSADVPPELRAIAVAIGHQMDHGGLDLERLVGLLPSAEAVPVLASILGRIEQRGFFDKSRVWRHAEDTDEVWARCLREIERTALKRRRRELEELKARAREAGDDEGADAMGRELRELLRASATER